MQLTLVLTLLVLMLTLTFRDMDVVVTELAAALPVDIMPGADDPTNVALPQQPLHRWVRSLGRQLRGGGGAHQWS